MVLFYNKMTYPLIFNLYGIEQIGGVTKIILLLRKRFILDGMVNSGLISNDGWDQIGDFSDSFRIDKENPRVEVIFKRAE